MNLYENSFPIYKGSDSITINIYGVDFFPVMLLKVIGMCKEHESLWICVVKSEIKRRENFRHSSTITFNQGDSVKTCLKSVLKLNTSQILLTPVENSNIEKILYNTELQNYTACLVFYLDFILYA